MYARETRRRRLLVLLPTKTYRAEAFIDAASRLDVDLTVASERDSAFTDAEPSRLLTVDLRYPERAVEQVRAFAERHPIDAAVGIDDETTVVAAAVSEALGLDHNPRAAVEAARDKRRQREILRSCGVPVPDFACYHLSEDVDAVARATTYPCVLKPLTLSASRGVMRANTRDEFRDAHGRLAAILAARDLTAQGTAGDEYLVESFVTGPEFAIEALLVDGEFHVLALFDKPDPLEGPFFEETIYVTPSRHPRVMQEALVACAARATRALDLRRGPVHAELRYNDRGVWLIELAARPIGGKCGQVLRFGPDGRISLEQLLLRHALGIAEVPPREVGSAGVMMIPIPRAGVLKEVTGIADALAVPGVVDVIMTAHRGQRLVPLPEESRYLGFIFARAVEPEQVERAIRDAHACLVVIVE